MKKIIIILLAVLPVAVLAQSTPFVINGHFPGLKENTYMFINYTTGGKNIHDSSQVINGNFVYRGIRKEKDPIIGYIMLRHSGPIQNSRYDTHQIFIDSSLTTIVGTDSIRYAKAVNSKLNKDYEQLNQLIAPTQDSIAALKKAFYSASKEKQADQKFRDSIDRSSANALANGMRKQYDFIAQHPDSYLSLLLLQQSVKDSTDIKKAEPLFHSFSDRIKSTNAGKDFELLIQSVSRTAIGKQAPDFMQKDVNGKPVRLSDFRGKYVLIDFWASWCGPCRKENPNVLKAYNRFKSKNFTVLGVSLDYPGKKVAWQAAIKQDGLTWTQVSDLKGWDNEVVKLYGIKFVPQNFLIDPNGKIIAARLEGDELTAKLEALLGR